MSRSLLGEKIFPDACVYMVFMNMIFFKYGFVKYEFAFLLHV